MVQEQMSTIRCRSCRQMLGIGPSDFRIYCDEVCANEVPASINEERDALISAIYHTRSISKTALAKEWDMSRQRVEQIVAARIR